MTYITAARSHVQRRDSKSSIHKENKDEDCERNDEESTVEDAIPANNDESKEDDHADKSETEVSVHFENNMCPGTAIQSCCFFFTI